MNEIQTANYKLFGAHMFNQLPAWARMLEWKEGKPDFDEWGTIKEPCAILYPKQDGKVGCMIVGEENLNGGVCDCCPNGWKWSHKDQQVFAHAKLPFLDLEKVF